MATLINQSQRPRRRTEKLNPSATPRMKERDGRPELMKIGQPRGGGKANEKQAELGQGERRQSPTQATAARPGRKGEKPCSHIELITIPARANFRLSERESSLTAPILRGTPGRTTSEDRLFAQVSFPHGIKKATALLQISLKGGKQKCEKSRIEHTTTSSE